MKQFIFSLIIIGFSALVFAQTSPAEHCQYLQAADPESCVTSQICTATVKKNGLCESTMPENVKKCGILSGYQTVCDGNRNLGCYFVSQKQITCIPK